MKAQCFRLQSIPPVYSLKGDNTDMDILTTETLKEELINRDPEFRELAREHHKYEERLTELSSLAYPSDEEQIEETTLKKKKLALKDQMYSIMLQYQRTHDTSH
jgi:uncharacterized protein YdcH (DUF465 family)